MILTNVPVNSRSGSASGRWWHGPGSRGAVGGDGTDPPRKYTRTMRGAVPRWGLLAAILLVVILVPFFLLEATIVEVLQQVRGSEGGRASVMLAISALLAVDVVLPIPSSLVATASGMLLGFGEGVAVVWTGMQAGAFVGYGLGRSAGSWTVRRLVGREELDRAAGLHRRWGGFSLVASRAVPVLAESTVVFAGVVRMPVSQFTWLTALSNAGIALVYAAVGAHAMETTAFLAAFGGSIAIPGVLIGLHRLVAHRAPNEVGGPDLGSGRAAQ